MTATRKHLRAATHAQGRSGHRSFRLKKKVIARGKGVDRHCTDRCMKKPGRITPTRSPDELTESRPSLKLPADSDPFPPRKWPEVGIVVHGRRPRIGRVCGLGKQFGLPRNREISSNVHRSTSTPTCF